MDWLIDQSIEWLIDWLICLLAWLIGWLIDCTVGCLIDYILDWLIDWLVDFACLLAYLTDWLMDRLIAWLIDSSGRMRYFMVMHKSRVPTPWWMKPAVIPRFCLLPKVYTVALSPPGHVWHLSGQTDWRNNGERDVGKWNGGRQDRISEAKTRGIGGRTVFFRGV